MKRLFPPNLVTLTGVFLISLFLLPALALAQEGGTIGVPGFNIGALFADTAALAAFIIPVVAFIRGHIWVTLDGWPAVVVTCLIGIALGVIGFYMNLLHVNYIGEAITFGMTAAIIAMGGVKTASKVMSTRVALPGTPTTLPNPPLYPTDPTGTKPDPQTDPR